MLSQDSEDEIRSRFVFELAIWLWQVELNPRVRCAFGNVFILRLPIKTTSSVNSHYFLFFFPHRPICKRLRVHLPRVLRVRCRLVERMGEWAARLWQKPTPAAKNAKKDFPVFSKTSTQKYFLVTSEIWKAHGSIDEMHHLNINITDPATFFWPTFLYGLLITYFWYQISGFWHLWNILYEIFMKLEPGDMTMTGRLPRPTHFSDPTDPVHIKQQVAT